MLSQIAELLLRYPDEAQRVAAAEALPVPNPFLPRPFCMNSNAYMELEHLLEPSHPEAAIHQQQLARLAGLPEQECERVR